MMTDTYSGVHVDEEFTWENIVNSFKKYGIGNAMDGSKADIHFDCNIESYDRISDYFSIDHESNLDFVF